MTNCGAADSFTEWEEVVASTAEDVFMVVPKQRYTHGAICKVFRQKPRRAELSQPRTSLTTFSSNWEADIYVEANTIRRRFIISPMGIT